MEEFVIRRLVLICMILLGSAMLAWSAVSGTIRGRVLDASGQAVPGAEIVVANSVSGAVQRTTTAADGGFEIDIK